MGRTAGYLGLFGLTGVAARAAVTLALSLAAPTMLTASEDDWAEGMSLDVPSGQPVTLLEINHQDGNRGGSAIHVRFLAPEIARDTGRIAFSQAEEDMAVICQDYVLPHLSKITETEPEQIVIVLADRWVEFGVSDMDATQFFEAFRPENGVCVWDGF
ncbi:hypothetical protein SAMN04488030_3128 [Aliiroseovarius halocynthiae]|uniref:Acetolactate synthase n=1 Tax=Aliiroseovarius halocynthiae TaxID=985055 RepID=A0A545SM84_9RHOB|nr:DUF6497 family protein [Aliiroseovarius halocynthiae]TQV66074.1 hypothetical protein FIL88_15010 [Aliiroseovarius halocynthiae]SMR83214.1 hypothetical protein SAMN04488030_3128 [Aliiroseovarius halocynthiae]